MLNTGLHPNFTIFQKIFSEQFDDRLLMFLYVVFQLCNNIDGTVINISLMYYILLKLSINIAYT